MEGKDIYGGMSSNEDEMLGDVGFSGSQIRQITVMADDVEQRYWDWSLHSIEHCSVLTGELMGLVPHQIQGCGGGAAVHQPTGGAV